MYSVIIYGYPDKFSVAVHGKEFNRRGLLKFLSRHVNKLVDYDTAVAVSRDHGPARLVNFFLVGKKHMIDRIPTDRFFHPTRS